MSVSLPELEMSKSPPRPSLSSISRHGNSRSAAGLSTEIVGAGRLSQHGMAHNDLGDRQSRRHCHSVDNVAAGHAGLSRYEGTSLPELRNVPSSRGLRTKSPAKRHHTADIDQVMDSRGPPPSVRDSRCDLKPQFGMSSPGLTTNMTSPARSSRMGDLGIPRHDAPDDSRGTFREVENLKRQVTRLTQQRRDRDNYIQELLTAAEAAQARHEAEMARWSSRSQREVNERLAAQQREHVLLMEERSRAHAAALAQQAVQHELELEELRKIYRAGGDQRLAERLGDCVSQHRDALARLQNGAEDLRQRLASLVVALEDMPLPVASALEQEDLCSGLPSLDTNVQSFACQLTPSGPEPEPEAPEGVGEQPEFRKTLAFVQKSARESADDVELTLNTMRADLERAQVAERRLAIWFAHEATLQTGDCRSNFIVPAKARSKQERSSRDPQLRHMREALVTSWCRLLCAKVFLEWRGVARRLRGLAAERGRSKDVRRRLRSWTSRNLLNQEVQYHSITFHVWATVATAGRSVCRAALEATEAKRKRRQHSLDALASKAKMEKLLYLRSWAAASVRARHEARHVEALSKVSCLRAEAQSLQGAKERSAALLRQSRRESSFRSVKAQSCHLIFAALQGWRFAAVQFRLVKHHEAKLAATTVEAAGELLKLKTDASQREERLRKQCRELWFASMSADKAHMQHLTLRAWMQFSGQRRHERHHAEHVSAGLQEIDALRQRRRCSGIRRMNADLFGFKLTVLRGWLNHTEQSKGHKNLLQAAASVETSSVSTQQLRVQLRNQALHAARAWAHCRLGEVLFWWAAILREKRREAVHRRELLTAAADASAELYRFRSAAKATACDLRRQRRAHGVAAVHANLDRRVQAVLAAWWNLVRETQRESSFRRQLDAAAAESAQTCAAMRLEGRRLALELRKQRRSLGLRAIKSEMKLWRQAVLRAWAAVAAESRQQAVFLNDLAGVFHDGAGSADELRATNSSSRPKDGMPQGGAPIVPLKKMPCSSSKGFGFGGVLEKWRKAHGAAVSSLRFALLLYGVHMWQAAVLLRRSFGNRAVSNDVASREQDSPAAH